MIITVTMNPAIDKTLDVEYLDKGGLNRIQHVELDVGGKGINVSKTIRQLGDKSIATGFVAGNNGKIVSSVLAELGIDTDFVEVEGETRTNTKVYESTGEVTELNEPGPEINGEQVQQLLDKIQNYAGPDTLVVLAGSVPNGVDTDIYAKITRLVHEKGGQVLVDADGELFVKALEAGPDMIKPNRDELQKYAEMDYLASEKELLFFAKKMMQKGVSRMAVSMGRSGALFLGEDYEIKCEGLVVNAHSTVGAGDAMVAAMAYGWNQHLDREEQIRYCMATSAGAVTTIGTKPPAKELIEELKDQVKIVYL